LARETFLKWVGGAFALALVVVVLGAFTRLVDAGLGCPDWPGCYGFLHVPTSGEDIAAAEVRHPDSPLEAGKAWAEMVHRYFASGLGLVILVIAVIAWRNAGRGLPVRLPYALLAVVILQGAFGAWTVTLKLWPQVVTAHLLGGFATLALLWITALRAGFLERLRVPPETARHAAFALACVVVQVALGGWVTSNYAALACPDFPTCHDAWLPAADFARGFDLFQSVGPNYLGGMLESDARVAIQIAHRLGALVVLAVVGSLAWRLIVNGCELGAWLAGILVAQLTLGVLNVVLALPLAIATLHNAVGALLTIAIVTVVHHAWRDQRAAAWLVESRA
jgi:cytochrome c oxidase assembly protein subunit 15